MTKGGESVRVHYKGDSEDFIAFASGLGPLEKFRKNKSIPLVEVADVFAVYVTHGQGAEGVLDQASNSTLENNFGTKNKDEVLEKIFREGEVLGESHVGSRHKET